MSTITSDIIAGSNIISSGLFIGGDTKAIIFSTNSGLNSNITINNRENYIFGANAFSVGVTGNTSSGNIAFGSNAISTSQSVTGNIAIGNKYLLKQDAGNKNVLIGSNYIYTTNFDVDNLKLFPGYANYNAEKPVSFSQNSQNIAIPGGYIGEDKVQSGYIYISKDGGQSFQTIKPYSGSLSGFGIFDSAFISSDGKYINAKMQNPDIPGDSIIFQSFDSGNNWGILGYRYSDLLGIGRSGYLDKKPYEFISELFINSDSKFQITSEFDSLSISNNYGQSRESVNLPPLGATPIALDASDDIKYITFSLNVLVGSIFYFSTDSGNSWITKTGIPYAFFPYDISMSKDGKTQVFCGSTNIDYYPTRYPFLSGRSGYLAVSNDYGVSWNYHYTSGVLESVKISDDGKFQYAAPQQSGKLIYSNNSGLSFNTVTTSPILNYTEISLSNDGKYILAVSDVTQATFVDQPVNPSGTVIVSYNSGLNWTSLFSGTRGYRSCDMTPDGRIQIIGGLGRGAVSGSRTFRNLDISYDYGTNWTNIQSGKNMRPIRLTDDGGIMIGLQPSPEYPKLFKIEAPYRSIFYDLNNNYHAGSSGYYNLEKISHYKTSDDGRYQVALTNVTGYNPFNSGRFTRLQTIWNSVDSGKNWSYLHSLPDQTTQLTSPVEYGDFDYSLNGFALYGITKTFWPTGTLGYGNILTSFSNTGVPAEALDWVRVSPFIIKNINNALSEGDIITSQYKWQAPYYVFDWQGTFFSLGFRDAIGTFPYTGGRTLSWSTRAPGSTSALNTPSRGVIDFPGNYDAGRLEKVFYYKDDMVDLYKEVNPSSTLPRNLTIKTSFKIFDLNENTDIFGNRNGAFGAYIKIQNDKIKTSIGSAYDSLGNPFEITSKYSLKTGEFINVTTTYDTEKKQIHLYVNDSFDNSGTYSYLVLPPYYGTWSGYVFNGASNTIANLTTYNGTIDGAKSGIQFLTTSLYTGALSRWYVEYKDYFPVLSSSSNGFYLAKNSNMHAVIDPNAKSGFAIFDPVTEDLLTGKEWQDPTFLEGDYRPFYQDPTLYFGTTSYSMFGQSTNPLPNNIDLKSSRFGSLYINEEGKEIIALAESGFDNYYYYQGLEEYIPPAPAAFDSEGYFVKHFRKIEIDSKDVLDQEYKVYPSRDFKQFILIAKADNTTEDNIYYTATGEFVKSTQKNNNVILNDNINLSYDTTRQDLDLNIFLPGVQRNFEESKENIVLGYNSLDYTKTGSLNLVIGNNSLSNSEQHNQHNKNLVIGNNSILNKKSKDNIVIGSENLNQDNNYDKEVKNNISIGYQAGKYIGYEDKLITTSIIDSGASSITYGNNFISKEAIRNYGRGDMSADGKYQVVPLTSSYGRIYRSEDYGETWRLVLIPSATGTAFTNIEMSADGKYLVGYSSRHVNISLPPTGTTAPYFFTSSDYGLNWTPNLNILATGYRTWGDVAISADGRYQSLILKDVATTGGPNNNPAFWTNDKMISRKGKIVYSEDYGNTWGAKDSPESFYYKSQSNAIAMSANGQYQGIVGMEGYFTSEDYGNNWILNTGWDTQDYAYYADLTISNDGRFHVIATSPPLIPGSVVTGGMPVNAEILFSNDYGKTIDRATHIRGYIPAFSPSTLQNTKLYIDTSSDGKYQLLLRSYFPDDAYVSINSGISWNRIIDNPRRWPTILGGLGIDLRRSLRTSAISKDGRYLLVAGRNAPIYTYKTPLIGFDLSLDDNILIGNEAGKNSYPLQNTIAIGSNSLSSGFHQDIISIGSHSYTGCISAEHNINIGNNLFNFKTGNSNIAIGQNSFNRTQTGFNNIGIGNESLQNNLSKDNIAIGYKSQIGDLSSNLYNTNNLSIGNYTLIDANSSNNIAIGNFSLSGRNTRVVRPFNAPIQLVEVPSGISFRTSDQRNNLSIGHNTSVYNAAGRFNITIGNSNSKKAYNTNNNIILGNNIFTEESTSEFRTGDNNTMIGNRSALNISATSNNVLIGSDTLTKIDISDKNVIIGNRSITGILNTESYISEIIVSGVTPDILNGSYKYYNYDDGYYKIAYINDNQISYIYWSGNSLDPVDFQTLILVAFTGEENNEQEYFYYSTSPNINNISSGTYNQFNPWYSLPIGTTLTLSGGTYSNGTYNIDFSNLVNNQIFSGEDGKYLQYIALSYVTGWLLFDPAFPYNGNNPYDTTTSLTNGWVDSWGGLVVPTGTLTSGSANYMPASPSSFSSTLIYSPKILKMDNGIILGSNINTTGYSFSIILGNENITGLRCQATSITSLSDIRDKKNIKYLDNQSLKFINEIHPSEFLWNTRDGSKKDVKDVGFIAQDILTALSNNKISNDKIVDIKDSNKLGLAQEKLLPFIVDAVKELSDKIEDFGTKVDNFNKD